MESDVIDLTGRPIRNEGKGPGRRISWQQLAKQTGRPAPLGAVLRPKSARQPKDPVPVEEHWLDGRKRRFPMRWSDSKRRWRGWTIAVPEPAETPMAMLMRPLSAARTARHWRDGTVEPVVRVAKRFPLMEEFATGRISTRHLTGAEWFFSSLTEEPAELAGGARSSGSSDSDGGGSMVPMWSRNPLALWPAEIAWDQHQRIGKRLRTLGPLARILLRALEGAEMRELAPAWSFSQRNLPEAGRIRLRAALEVCARMAEREADQIPQWEVLEIAQTACAECERLVSSRRMRALHAANDNTPQRRAA